MVYSQSHSTFKTRLEPHLSNALVRSALWLTVLLAFLTTLAVLDPVDGLADSLLTYTPMVLFAGYLLRKHGLDIHLTPATDDTIFDPYTSGAVSGMCLVPFLILGLGMMKTGLTLSQLPLEYLASQAVVIFAIVAPVEELLYRNVIQEYLYTNGSVVSAAVGGFVIFTVSHLPGVVVGGSGFPLVIAGVVTVVYHFKRSVALTIFFHGMLNLTVAIGLVFF